MNQLKTLIALICCITFHIDAQLINFSPEHIFEQFPAFNEKYVQIKRIKAVVFDIIDKKDWQEAEDKNLVEVYEFYTNGKLKRQYHTTIKKIIQYETVQNSRSRFQQKNKPIIVKEKYEYDTISTEYIYQTNLIIQRHRYPNNYIEATYYKLCGNWICKEEKYVETYRQLSTGNSVLDKMYIKAYDSIVTYDYGQQIKQLYYNNEKLPYKEKFIYKNAQQQIYQIIEQLIVAQGRIKKEFVYLSATQLDSAKMTIDYGQPEHYLIKYQYDEQQRVLAEWHYKHNQIVKEYQYIYNQNNQELKSILIRTPENKNIRIIKLNFEYY